MLLEIYNKSDEFMWSNLIVEECIKLIENDVFCYQL